MNLIDVPANNSPSLAIDPTEPRFVVEANRQDAPFGCALEVSGDGGRGWVTDDPVPRLPAGADSCYGPEVTFDGRGTLYFLFVGLHGSGNSPMGAFLTSSTDRGRTFSPPMQVLGPERYQVRMALDPTVGRSGRIHLVWLEAGAPPPAGGLAPVPNPIMAAHSDDSGKTFSSPVQVSDPDRPRSVAPALAVAKDHSVQVVYYDLKADARDYEGLEGPPWDGTWSVVSATSTDGGGHFEPGVVVEADVVPPGRVMLIYTMAPPSLAADGSGDLYVAWSDARTVDSDVFLRRSTDGGRQFGAAVRLNDDAVGSGHSQYLPRLSVASNGRIDAIFYDRRADPQNRRNHVFYTYSRDRGVTWSRNRRLTVWDSDSQIGPQYTVASAKGLIEIGSRLALISTPSKVLAAWTDTRNTQRGNGAQDIFGVEVDFERPSGSPGWARIVGIATLFGGVALAATVWARRRTATEVTTE